MELKQIYVKLEHSSSKGRKMNRRSFISLAAISGASLPLIAQEITSAKKPEEANSVEEVLMLLFGNRKIVEDKSIQIKVPKVASHGGQVPISIKSSKEAKQIVVIAEENKKPLIGVFIVPKDAIIDYMLKFRITSDSRKTHVQIIIEDINGNLYRNKTNLKVQTAGGCEG